MIDNSGVGLISFLLVFMGLGFSGDGGGVCCFGKWFDWRGGVANGRFGSRMVSLVSYLQVVSLIFMNLVWMNVKEYLVMGLWVYFLDLWI